MRGIKFRGKVRDDKIPRVYKTGEWVYGYLTTEKTNVRSLSFLELKNREVTGNIYE